MRKVLIANRGEIARRIARSARARGLGVVAVASTPDLLSPFDREADVVVHLEGASPAATYLNTRAIIDAALSSGADAIHPGYGFLSENAAFARAVLDAGLTFIGPSPLVIEQMGSKLAAKKLMADAGVPVLPGGVVTSVFDIESIANVTGWPLLLKASAGGGGRGMRVLDGPDDLARHFEGATSEAEAAFGDATVFVERLVRDPRHIEVQIAGDTFGTVCDLFERECSIQRRYQKIIEEAPSVAVDDELRERLRDAARKAASALRYVGVGTVEFVLDQDGEFFFLEVNTRLQVEHPVTELVTGIDLVDLQFDIADDRPLSDSVTKATLRGHAIEARLYAEDPGAGFLPQAGTFSAFSFAEAEGIRIDSGVEVGTAVSSHYDPMVAKIIASGRDRSEAIDRLVAALRGARLHGVVTNRDLLIGILDHDEFRSGDIDTGFLTRHEPTTLASSDHQAIERHLIAAVLCDRAARAATTTLHLGIEAGWRNVPTEPERVTFRCGGTDFEMSYSIARSGASIAINGEIAHGLKVHDVTSDAATFEIDGLVTTVSVQRVGDRRFCDGGGASTTLTAAPRFIPPSARVATGSLVAPMPGSVVSVLVEVGDVVQAGAPLVVVEAMKMQHTVTSPHDGTVTEISVRPGAQVEALSLLVVVEPNGQDNG